MADAAAALAAIHRATMRDVFDVCVRFGLENLAQGMIETPPPLKLRQRAARLLLGESEGGGGSGGGVVDSALSDTHHMYRARAGEVDFREAAAFLMRDLHGCGSVKAANVLATSGVSGAIVSVLRSVALKKIQQAEEEQQHGQQQPRIALLTPFYTYHAVQIRTALGVEPIYIDCREADLGPDFAAIETALSSPQGPIDVLLFCNPGNPQGHVWAKADVDRVVAIAAAHGTLVMIDEIYADLVFEPAQHYTPASAEHMPENVIVCRGFSKSLGAQSWRAGFLVASEARVQEVLRVHDPLYICTTWQQHALASYITEDLGDYRRHVHELQQLLQENWRVLAPAFESVFGWKALEPQGSMYGMFAYGDTAATDMEAVGHALKMGFGVAPGNIFFGGNKERTGYVRIHVGFSAEKRAKYAQILQQTGVDASGDAEVQKTDADVIQLFGEGEESSVTFGRWSLRLTPQESVHLPSIGAKVEIDQNSKGFGELGSRVWDGSFVLSLYFDWCVATGNGVVTLPGARALELGAGTGLAGIVAAKLGAQEVILTDKQSLVSLLEHNASKNAVADRVKCCELLWGESLREDASRPAPLQAAAARGETGLDFIFGADLTYDFDDLPVLVSTISALLQPFPKASCLIAYGIERAATPEFLRQAAEIFEVQIIPSTAIPQRDERIATHQISIAVLKLRS